MEESDLREPVAGFEPATYGLKAVTLLLVSITGSTSYVALDLTELYRQKYGHVNEMSSDFPEFLSTVLETLCGSFTPA